MDNQRQERIARLLQKELGEMFITFEREKRGVIVSVSEVRVTSDLGLARVYLSVFPPQKTDEIVEFVQAETKSFRFNLGRRVKNQLRLVPQLVFYRDDSIEKLERIDELLNK